MGQDVFLLLDSITRLARAFNKWVGNTGRTMSGGVDIKAMDIPKKLFATARAFEEGGSLTVVGTALIDTGSRMDELIFQEFKGTGNMELVLDRKLADRRVWPAIDITQSGTRREELLARPETLHAVTMLRRTLTSMHHVDAMEQLTKQLGRFKTNAEFIKLISGAESARLAGLQAVARIQCLQASGLQASCLQWSSAARPRGRSLGVESLGGRAYSSGDGAGRSSRTIPDTLNYESLG
jgi:transcription termination factor Rho